MYYLAGMVVGAAIGMLLLSLLVGLFFKQSPPGERAFRAALIATLVGCALFTLTSGFIPLRLAMYVLGGGISYAFLRWHYGTDWIDDDEQLEETFR